VRPARSTTASRRCETRGGTGADHQRQRGEPDFFARRVSVPSIGCRRSSGSSPLASATN